MDDRVERDGAVCDASRDAPDALDACAPRATPLPVETERWREDTLADRTDEVTDMGATGGDEAAVTVDDVEGPRNVLEALV